MFSNSQNHNKLEKNINNILKQSSTFKETQKYLTLESNTTKLDTISSEIEEDDIIENFLKDKYKILNDSPNESLNHNVIIHKWYVLINVIIAIFKMRKFNIKNLSSSNLNEIFNKKKVIQVKNKFKNQ